MDGSSRIELQFKYIRVVKLGDIQVSSVPAVNNQGEVSKPRHPNELPQRAQLEVMADSHT